MGRLKYALTALVAFLLPSLAEAAVCGTVSNCPFASTPLSGAELLYVVQNGNSTKTNVNSLLQLLISNSNASAFSVTPTGATGSSTLANISARVLNADDFNTGAIIIHGDGVTDDSAALNAAMNTLVSTPGGGTLQLNPNKQYLINTANLVIPTRVRLACDGSMQFGQRITTDYAAAGCALIVNPAYSV